MALYKEYVEKNPQDSVAFSTFCEKKKRSRNILSYTKTPLVQCLCEICHDPKMKAKALNQFLDSDSKTGGIQDLIKMTLCPTANKFADRLCIDRQCRNCGVQKFKNELTQ